MATTSVNTEGIVSDGDKMGFAKVTVRFTHDSKGQESISLQSGKLMIQVPFERVKPIIAKATSAEKKLTKEFRKK